VADIRIAFLNSKKTDMPEKYHNKKFARENWLGGNFKKHQIGRLNWDGRE